VIIRSRKSKDILYNDTIRNRKSKDILYNDTIRQTMIHRTLHRRQKIEQPEPLKNRG
jgi:hypothetical protein